MSKQITKLLDTIRLMKARGAFRNYIDYIQFPYFRNLEKSTRITFDFPLTVFVGQNGSGKSSTLHALYGAPMRNTPFEFWFSTAVDPVLEVSDGGDRHCFFYAYKDSGGNPLEVLKLRIFKRNNPDYWETSRPIVSYGMAQLPGGQRNQPVEKDLVYIDFRSELSAFDKYFYFKNPSRTKTIKNKQDYLRKYSKFLKQIIDNITPSIVRYGIKQNEPVRNLTRQELDNISEILGRTYISGKLIKHKLFEEWGYSAFFITSTYSYSEAFAGSGEMAVVRLVTELLSAPRYALVLLDEPEVSLHPGAQKRLKHFILELIRQKQLQVVISSHSPSIIEDLPPNAIKVFSQMPDGKFHVTNSMHPEEAFFHLEQSNPNKKTIIVEDLLAKQLVLAVLKAMGEHTESLFDVTYYSGGASVIKNHFITVYSREANSKHFVLLDGDQRPATGHFDPNSIIFLEQTTQRYKAEILKQTGSDVQFYPDGNADEGARADQEKELRNLYLKCYLRNVYYLPKNHPEEIIWDQAVAESFLTTLSKPQFISQVQGAISIKEKLRLLSLALTGDNSGIDTIEKMLLQHWIQKNDESFDEIVRIISILRDF